jgi:hypothetical protein
MRLLRPFVPVVIGASLITAAPSWPAGTPSPDALAGDWETVIAAPERPWNFMTRFSRNAAAWSGVMLVEGLGEFPLSGVRFDPPTVRFRLPPQLDTLAFEGTLEGDGVTGRVKRGEEDVPVRLTRAVPLPEPADRNQAWLQDLEVAGEHLEQYDRSFTPATREAFERAMAELESEVPAKDDAEILTGLSCAVALAGNAHTRLRLDPTRQGTFSTEFPIRIWWFADGPYVVKAMPEYRRALRCRVTAIDGHPIADVRHQIETVFAGNAAWHAYLVPMYLESPDILHGLGVIATAEKARFTLEGGPGPFTLDVRAVPMQETDESWRVLSPLPTRDGRDWSPALAADPEKLPWYLRRPDDAYWFRYLPGKGLLYLQFNRAEDASRGPSFREFGDSLLAFAAGHPVERTVIDLRFNSGGDLEVAKPFLRRLAADAGIDRPGHLFVVVGPCTFSAGLYHAAQLAEFSHAEFVGEPPGDRLDYWAEGGEIVLPNSGAAIWYSNGFHRYSTKEYPANRPYYEELRIQDLRLELATPLTSRDYFMGRDPALRSLAVSRR